MGLEEVNPLRPITIGLWSWEEGGLAWILCLFHLNSQERRTIFQNQMHILANGHFTFLLQIQKEQFSAPD